MDKRSVTLNGRTYKVRSDSVEIPDLEAMSSIAAAVWINQHTYRRGYHAAPNPLRGLGEVLNVRTS